MSPDAGPCSTPMSACQTHPPSHRVKAETISGFASESALVGPKVRPPLSLGSNPARGRSGASAARPAADRGTASRRITFKTHCARSPGHSPRQNRRGGLGGPPGSRATPAVSREPDYGRRATPFWATAAAWLGSYGLVGQRISPDRPKPRLLYRTWTPWTLHGQPRRTVDNHSLLRRSQVPKAP